MAARQSSSSTGNCRCKVTTWKPRNPNFYLKKFAKHQLFNVCSSSIIGYSTIFHFSTLSTIYVPLHNFHSGVNNPYPCERGGKGGNRWKIPHETSTIASKVRSKTLTRPAALTCGKPRAHRPKVCVAWGENTQKIGPRRGPHTPGYAPDHNPLQASN